MTLTAASHIPRGHTTTAAELRDLRRFGDTAVECFQQRRSHAGPYVAPARGHGMDYAESRQYYAGDDLRRIDWPVTARTGQPHTKVFHVEQGHEYLALLDLRESMWFGTRSAFKSVLAMHTVAVAAWGAARQGGRFGAVTLSTEVHTHRTGPAQRTAPEFCGAIANLATERLRDEPQPELNAGVQALAANGSRSAAFIIVTDLSDPPALVRQALLTLAGRGEVSLIWIADPFELELPARERLGVLSQGQTLQLDAASSDVRTKHRDYVSTRVALLRELSAQGLARTRLVRCGDDLFRQLAKPAALSSLISGTDNAGGDG